METDKLIEILNKNCELHSKQIEGMKQIGDIVTDLMKSKNRNVIEETQLKMSTIISAISAGNFYLIGLVMFMLENVWAFVPAVIGVLISIGAIKRIYGSRKTV